MNTDLHKIEKLRPAYRILPPGYYQSGSFSEMLSLFQTVKLPLIILVLSIVFSLLFIFLLQLIRPGMGLFDLINDLIEENNELIKFLVVFGSIGLMFGLHEGFHNQFFRLFTKENLKSRMERTDSYDPLHCWFFPRPYYAMIRLAPLVLISLLAILLFIFLPTELLLFPLLMAVTNGIYSVIDIIETVVMATQPPNCLVEDRGDTLYWYLPVK